MKNIPLVQQVQRIYDLAGRYAKNSDDADQMVCEMLYICSINIHDPKGCEDAEENLSVNLEDTFNNLDSGGDLKIEFCKWDNKFFYR